MTLLTNMQTGSEKFGAPLKIRRISMLFVDFLLDYLIHHNGNNEDYL